MLKPPRGTPLNFTHPHSRGLIADYLMNVGTGNVIFDYSRNNHIGTIIGAVWGTGQTGFALSFSGSDRITLSGESGFDFEITDSFSISAVINTNDISAFQSIATKQKNDGSSGYMFLIDDSGRLECLLVSSSGSFKRKRVNASLATHTRYEVDVTYDGLDDVSGIILYVNGLAPAQTEVQNDAVDTLLTENPLMIGDRPIHDLGFKGEIESFAVRNYALTSDEISQIHVKPFARYDQAISPAVFAPVVSGLPISVAMNYYRQLRGC